MWLLVACAGAPPVEVRAPAVDQAVEDTAPAPPDPEVCGGGDEDDDGVVDEDGALGCVDDYRDLDGDGLGVGDPTCRCVPVGASVGGDCDDQNGWRGVDCTEGAEVALAGDRILHDHPDGYVNLVATGAFSSAGAELLMLGPGDTLVVAPAPAAGAGDVPLTELATVDVPFVNGLTLPVVGDVDGDGWPDAIGVGGTAEPVDDSFSELTLQLGVVDGPLGDPGRGLAVVTFPPRTTSAGLSAFSLFVDDLDGDGAAELTAALGTSAANSGETAVWRAQGGAVTVLEALDADTGHDLLVFGAGDLDGDGFRDLGRVGLEAGAPVVRLYAGPLAELPAAAAAAGVLSVPDVEQGLALGDLDGDGVDELCLREQRLWLVTGFGTGAVADVATAVIGAETDEPGESSLWATPVDLGDGPELLVGDPWWPHAHGAGNLRGALYRFPTAPTGVVDVRAAAERRYGEAYGGFGAWPGALSDGRLAVGANLLTTDVGTGVTWVLTP